MIDARSGRWIGAAAVSAVFLALTLGVIASGRIGTGESADQFNYHVPVIRSFAAQWPSPDLKKYDSATTPGYQLMMAALWRAAGLGERWPELPRAPVGAGPGAEWPAVTLGDAERTTWAAFVHDLRPLQAVNALLSLGLILTVYFGAARFAHWWLACSLTLPLMLNQYVLGAAIWLTTDNAAWFLAALALGGAALSPMTPARTLRAGVTAAVLVLVRQVHLWVCGPIAVSGLVAWAVEHPGRRGRGAWATAFAVALPVAVVAGFALLWQGLTPPSPRIREVHGGGANLATLAFALSLIGAYGVFAFAAWRDQLRGLGASARTTLVLVGVGVVLALLTATSTQAPTLTDPPMRGYGWLWKLSGMFPAVAGRSALLALGAPAGLLVLLMLWRGARAAGRSREALVLLVGLACWLLAQAMNPAAWQRYFDPMVLVLLAWLGALAVPERRTRALAVGAAVLALFMAGLSYRSVWRDLAKNELPFDGGVLKMQGKL